MKLQLNGKTYQLTIPASLVRAKNWKKGDELSITINNKGNLEVIKIN